MIRSRSQAILRCVMPLFAAALGATAASADVVVGDKPSLHFNAFPNGNATDLADLRGKIVVVDFWAGWCEPCAAQADHLLKVNQRYAGKGLQLLTINLDSDPTDMTSALQGKTFPWPVASETSGWSGPISKDWGVNSLPQTFVIGPDGVVLWRGHPKNLDAVLDDAFKQHPPQLLDNKAMAAVMTSLTQIESAITANKAADAAKLLAAIPPDAKADSRVADRLNAAISKLQDYATSQIAAAEAADKAGNYDDADAKMQEVAAAFASTPAGDTAKQKLAEWQSNQDRQAKRQVKQREKLADDALAAAKAVGKTKVFDSYQQYEAIIKDYSDVPSAVTKANDALAAYRGDPKVMHEVNRQLQRPAARALLTKAENYKGMKAFGSARNYYNQIIEQYPDTDEAGLAKKALDEIGLQ